jgi:hypothetical protein
MPKYSRRLAIGLAAALMLTFAVSAASARNISISNQNIRVVWSPLTFSGGGGIEARCRVTLEGSFHYRTIVKVERSLVGLITRAIAGRPCERNVGWAYNGTEVNEVLGRTVFPNSLPWHLTYERFTGTLPNITSITLLLANARFHVRINELFALCDYTTSAANGIAAGIATIGAGGVITGLRADESRRIRSESPFCPEGTFSGVGVVTLLGTTNSIFVRLI